MMLAWHLQFSFTVFDKHFSDYDPADTDNPNFDSDYIFQIPAYNTIDLHVFYNTGELLPVPVNVGFHLLNVTDTEYFADYRNGDGGFYGAGTTFNLSLGIDF